MPKLYTGEFHPHELTPVPGVRREPEHSFTRQLKPKPSVRARLRQALADRRHMTSLANNNEITERAAVSLLAMFGAMLISAIGFLAVGPGAFDGGAIVLLCFSVSIGTTNLKADEQSLLARFVDILLHVAICWWLFSDFLREYTGGGLKLASVLICSAMVYVSIGIVFFALLRWSPSFRRFACVKPRSGG